MKKTRARWMYALCLLLSGPPAWAVPLPSSEISQGEISHAAGAAPAGGVGGLPAYKLICFYTDLKISFRPGEATQSSLSFSNMGSLQFSGGAYVAGSGGRGSFVRSGNQVRFTSGTWAGAVGTLETDRSGEPAVVFRIEENRRPNGVHIIDPYTTRCSASR